MNPKIGIIGLGYVGLPLLMAFGRQFEVFGYDTSASRIKQLKRGIDKTKEVKSSDFDNLLNAVFTDQICDLAACNVYIITVPTPIDVAKNPDLSALKLACEEVAHILKNGDIVVFESTVYPGATEKICVPVLEAISKLEFNKDFFVGYSPERINPGDQDRRIETIIKLVSGSNENTLNVLAELYSSVITAGVYRASSIIVAEAAKIIENVQRDVNIALVNEFSQIFKRANIDTHEVLAAANTKWNFLPFEPGLVGGHCIGVDPYYLTHLSQSLGYHPEVILSGRRLNDQMGSIIAMDVIKFMSLRKLLMSGSKVLILGFAFKENCPDIRNTKVIDIYNELVACGLSVDIHDAVCDHSEIEQKYNVKCVKTLEQGGYSCAILAVPHDEYKMMNALEIRKLLKEGGIIYDVKNILPKYDSDYRL